MSNILVAYFSATGATARTAGQIASAVGGDLYEIRPAEPYSAADLDWTDSGSRSTAEMNDEACCPPLAEAVPCLEHYDTVFLGFPIWWYVEPRVVDSFVEAAGLEGKRVIPFATSGGSGIARAAARLRSLCPGADWAEGRRLAGGAAAWARGEVK